MYMKSNFWSPLLSDNDFVGPLFPPYERTRKRSYPLLPIRAKAENISKQADTKESGKKFKRVEERGVES